MDASEPQRTTQGEQKSLSDASETEHSPSVPSTPESEAHTHRKRKLEGQDIPKKSYKKVKRLLNAHIGRTRYFDVAQPIEGFDDDDNLLQSETPHYQSKVYSSGHPVTDPNQKKGLVSAFVTKDPGPNRGFSPSRPVLDSSDEEALVQGNKSSLLEDDQKADPEGPRTPTRRAFSPRLDSNTFRLTTGELKALYPPLDVGDPLATLILLPTGHSLTFVGTASITVLHGTLSILGTAVQPSFQSHRVFSPRSSPVVSLEARESFGIADNSLSLLSPNDPKGGTLPQRVQNMIRDSDRVIVIQSLHTGIEGLGKVCRTFDGVFDVTSDLRGQQVGDIIGIDGFHIVDPHSHPHPQLQPFFMPESWAKALDAADPAATSTANVAHSAWSNSFVALVKGPKKSGKSTFARTLLNHLTTRYRRVAFLECDLGQSEFTPGGLVSLHVITRPIFGPPFTHPTIPYRAHYVGHTTPRSNPSHYLSCIQALILTYRMDVQYAYQETLAGGYCFDDNDTANFSNENDSRSERFIPLVVNTQGWIKGLGGNLLRKIEEIVEATDIFDLDAQTPFLPPHYNQPSGASLHPVRPILTSPLTAYYTSSDHRSLSILSYFHCLFPTRGKEAKAWSVGLPLCAAPPWEVDCREAFDGIVLVGAGFEDVNLKELGCAINCGVVALVCEEDPTAELSAIQSESRLTSWPYTQGAPPPSPSTSYCVGLALIRGVDVTSCTLHILTPVSPALLSSCRILVKGELELPVWGMLDFRQGQADGVAGVKWGKVPYLQMGGGEPSAIGGARRRVRKNLMRRGQM